MINKKIKFKEISLSDAKIILKWRRKKRISDYQYTNISSSLKLQKEWILESYKKKDYYHWLILFKKKPIGFICIKDLDLKKKETDWAFYIGSEDHLTLGSFLPPFFYNWVFKKFKINRINSFVFESNNNVIKIHKYHGYKVLKKFTIIKNKKKIKCIKMILLKKSWDTNKYSNYLSDFPILKWDRQDHK
jgi:RimJ/RimL family protein N-acetyltransferase